MTTQSTGPYLFHKPEIDRGLVAQVGSAAGVSDEIIDAALTAVTSGRVFGLEMSGKIVSGKDTIGPGVLAELGVHGYTHLMFAKALKHEFNVIMNHLRAADTPRQAQDVLEGMDLPPYGSAQLIELLWDHVRENVALTATDRTPPIRSGLIMLGTDIRREQNINYWVNISIAEALGEMAQGHSLMYTDARFPNEIDLAKAVGIYSVRLDISADTQRRRLWERDGLEPDPAALSHISETALDGYTGFDLVVDNNGTAQEGIDAVLAVLDPSLIHA